MSFWPSKLLWLLVLGVATVSASAQPATLMTKPSDATGDSISSSPDNSQREINAGDYNAPRQLFRDFSPSLGQPQPLFLGKQNASVQDALNKRKNWMLSTPEQILGVQTAEQIMGVVDPNGESKLPMEEQFLLRQRRAAASAATNGRPNSPSWRDDSNLSNKKTAEQTLFSRGPFSQPDEELPMRVPGGNQTSNPLFDGKVKDGFFKDDRKPASDWASAFAQPKQAKPTAAQLADMENFRAMLEPGSAPDKTPVSTRIASPSAPVVDPFLQRQTTLNPAGRSVAQLEDHVSRPTGIQPLPGITGAAKPVSKTRPTWQAQLPPWLSDGSQPHNQSRNF